METTDAFAGVECVDCGHAQAGTASGRCPECGGIFDPTYDRADRSLDPGDLSDRSFASMWRYRELLPFERRGAVTLDEGGTRLVECPALAEEMGVGRVLVKDEGENPTGGLEDRGASLAITAARGDGASDVALSSTGNGGQAVAAYAARAGLDAHVFVPSRGNFANKAMVNVHGADMNVVGGRIGDARSAYERALDERGDWHPVGAFDTPYSHEGTKTILYEVVDQLDWSVPDAVVCPTADGELLAGLSKAATELRQPGLVEDRPALYAAQAAGCDPIVAAFEAGRDRPEAHDNPDTICGELEVPDPAGGHLAVEAIRESDGGAVAVEDDDALEAAVAVAGRAGLGADVACGVAAAGAWELARWGEFDADDTVVLVNSGTANREADVLRSHLMGKGI